METTMQPQEMTKEPMVELDTGGNAVDIELKEEKRKLEVMVKIFGRKTPLELSYMQVEKI